VNSLWLSGCGVARAATAAEPQTDDRLRGPALGEDWAAWAEAWRTLDAGDLAELLAAVRSGRTCTLTLCGERSAQRFENAPRALSQRLLARWRTAAPHTVLEAL
jgi:hypothetical protein